ASGAEPTEGRPPGRGDLVVARRPSPGHMGPRVATIRPAGLLRYAQEVPPCVTPCDPIGPVPTRAVRDPTGGAPGDPRAAPTRTPASRGGRTIVSGAAGHARDAALAPSAPGRYSFRIVGCGHRHASRRRECQLRAGSRWWRSRVWCGVGSP